MRGYGAVELAPRDCSSMSALPQLSLSGFDFAQARAFLDALAGKPNAQHLFLTFEDRDKGEKPSANDPRTRVLHGTLDEHARTLAQLNNARAGIFVAVNPQRGGWRSDANTIAPRAIWHENDGALKDNVAPHWPIPPSMVVRTRPDHSHIYWFLQPGQEDWEQWYGIARHMVTQRGSDPNCTKRCQVLRVPGFYHTKNANSPSLVSIVQPYNGKRYALPDLASAYPPVARQHGIEAEDSDGLQTVNEAKWSDIVRMLGHIDPDKGRDQWIRVLMALEETKHPDRRIVADEWSRKDGKSEKYLEGEVEYQMNSFKRTEGPRVGIGSIVHFAKEGGYVADPVADLLGPEPAASKLPTFTHTTAGQALATEPPPQDFLLNGFLSGSHSMSAIAGRGGVGKSKLVLGIAASIATGMPAFGYTPLAPHVMGSSVLLDLENEPHEFSRRIRDHERAMRSHGQEVERLGASVHHVFIDRMLYPLTVSNNGAPMRHATNWNTLRDTLTRIRDQVGDVRWCCADALYKFHAVSENDPAHMVYAMEQINELVSAVFGAIPRSIVHHSTKGKAGDYFSDSGGGTMRGSGAIEAACRSVIQIRTLDDAECKLHGISKDQRRQFAVCSVTKSNYAVMQPDNFMLRTFGSAWWHCERSIVDDREPMAEAESRKLQSFMVGLHELMKLRGLRVTQSAIGTKYKRLFPGFQKAELIELLGEAEMRGYIYRKSGGAYGHYVWVDQPGADLGL